MPLHTLDVKTLEQLVLTKCDSFINMGLWPAGEKLRPLKWLSNFEEEEKECALYLLNSFAYFNIDMALALLRASIVNLTSYLPLSDRIFDLSSKWHQLLADAIFIPSTGENRNVTDSGNILAGHLRRDLGVPQDSIITVEQLYDRGYSSMLRRFKHVIFFDDFIGSGQQFVTMWTQPFEKDAKSYPSIKKQCEILKLKPHYCCMISTKYGADNIKALAPEVDLCFSHVLQPNASPLSDQSTTWPDHLKIKGPEFIFNASKRAGIPITHIKGFHDLGLSIAFSFTIPDATLPIFYWKTDKWSPLMERS